MNNNNNRNYEIRHIAAKAFRQTLLMRITTVVLLSVVLSMLVVFTAGQISNRSGFFEIKTFQLGEGKISLSNTADFATPTTLLQSESLENMTNISGMRDLPADIENTDGPHNGENYFAHTFYLQNAGDVNVDVQEKINVISHFKGAEKAVRVMVYRNGAATTYAAPREDGAPEYNTVAFLDEETACANRITALTPGEAVKYTVVIWLEGDDPDCTDNIQGGFVRFSMDFSVINGSGE